MTNDRGLYAYALIDPASSSRLDVLGIWDEPLRLVDHRDLAAVVSEVDLAEFGEAGLKQHLEDLAWLEQVAQAHDRVTRAAAAVSATAPLRLATVFRSEESVRQRLREWYDQARAVLDRVDGRAEWSVKAYAERAPEVASEARPTTGRDYLEHRRRAQRSQAEADRASQILAAKLHEQLHELAIASRLLAAQDRALSHHEGEMLLNAAYLIDNTAASTFADAVRAIDAESPLTVTIDGPWAPYSFASLEEA